MLKEMTTPDMWSKEPEVESKRKAEASARHWSFDSRFPIAMSYLLEDERQVTGEGIGEHWKTSNEFLEVQPSTDSLREVYDKLLLMQTWSSGWNGFEAKAPTQEAIELAKMWVQQIHGEVAKLEDVWQAPWTSADVDGEVLLEWENEGKTLSIYIDEDEISYIQDFGPEINSKMLEGELESPSDLVKLWKWLRA